MISCFFVRFLLLYLCVSPLYSPPHSTLYLICNNLIRVCDCECVYVCVLYVLASCANWCQPSTILLHLQFHEYDNTRGNNNNETVIILVGTEASSFKNQSSHCISY